MHIMNLIMKTQQSFLPPEDESRNGPVQNNYGLQTDIGLFNTYSSQAIAEFVRLKLIDCGLRVEGMPFVLNPDLDISDCWHVSIVNPSNQNLVFTLKSPDRLAVRTVATLMSERMNRHEIKVSKRGCVRNVFVHGLIVENNVHFVGAREPNDWV